MIADIYENRTIYCIYILPNTAGNEARTNASRQVIREECPNIISYTQFAELTVYMEDAVHYTADDYERLGVLLRQALANEA